MFLYRVLHSLCQPRVRVFVLVIFGLLKVVPVSEQCEPGRELQREKERERDKSDIGEVGLARGIRFHVPSL